MSENETRIVYETFYYKCITFGDVFFIAPLVVVSIQPNRVHR